MKIEQLIDMVNQIGGFFDAETNREEAMSDIADHLKKFWEPRMRRQIVAHVATQNGAGLSGIVRDAIARHSNALNGGRQTIMADDRWAGGGGSDAG
ncbi:MAG: formate dehydrogenase [Methylococcaceae bacterium]|nr:MAG: formate dehydrogenase [Methylococcaceae bacterium]